MNDQCDKEQPDAGGVNTPLMPSHGFVRGRPHRGARSQCKGSVMSLLTQFNQYDAKGARRVSDATKRERGDFLLRCVNDLHENGFKMRDITNICAKHITCLVKVWELRGYSASALQKYKSCLRTLLTWAGRDQLAKQLDRVVNEALTDPARILRIRVATEDKSWGSRLDDPLAKIEEVAKDDDRVGMCLRLQSAFGLRVREAWLLDPATAFEGINLSRRVLPVIRGTKGGRPREIPVTTPAQVELLREAVKHVDPRTRTLIPAKWSFESWSAHFYRICRRHGISRKDGIVTHGLRHGYAIDRYETISGLERPLIAGKPKDPEAKSADARARDMVSRELGHGRRSITSAYLGPNGPLRNPQSTDTARSGLRQKDKST